MHAFLLRFLFLRLFSAIAGYVAALWPNYRLARYCAAPQYGFDLNHAARPGEPVSVHTARQGVRVTRGRDWKWGGQDGGGRTGVLVRPVSLEPKWVTWEVEWCDGSRSCYRVGHNTWDLQVGLCWCTSRLQQHRVVPAVRAAH